MIDLSVEEPLPLAILARTVTNHRGGKGLSACTLWRWATSANRFGIRLESVLIGGVRMSTSEALQRYFEANTRAADGGAVAATPGQARQKAIAQAEAELDAAGI